MTEIGFAKQIDDASEADVRRAVARAIAAPPMFTPEQCELLANVEESVFEGRPDGKVIDDADDDL